MQPRFLRTALFVMAGLLIWSVDFAFTYVFAAVACARGFAGRSVLGMGIVPFAIVAATIVCAAAAGAVLWRALHGYRQARRASTADTEQFLLFTAFTVAALSLLAILWNGLAAWVPAC